MIKQEREYITHCKSDRETNRDIKDEQTCKERKICKTWNIKSKKRKGLVFL